MTRRPCAVVICCAYAAPDSAFCPVHRYLHAEGRLTVRPTKVVVRRPPRPSSRGKRGHVVDPREAPIDTGGPMTRNAHLEQTQDQVRPDLPLHQDDLFERPAPQGPLSLAAFRSHVEAFREFGTQTDVQEFPDPTYTLPVYVNEFWTAKQRAAHSLHEVSYRACFKPQLPRFFISRLTAPGERVYDPFMGRGTTVIEAALLGRRPVGCDINPLSRRLTLPRLDPPELSQIQARLRMLELSHPVDPWEDLLVFYHPTTLRALTNLKHYLEHRDRTGVLDPVDRWIRMVATNRLTGHSGGFFSVYTLPPNQAVTLEAQRKINDRRSQTRPARNVRDLILRKSRALLCQLQQRERHDLRVAAHEAPLLTRSCDHTPQIPDASVHLIVTSPPFLDVLDYQTDNWLRCWFNGIDAQTIPLWQLKSPQAWQARMAGVFAELRRVLAPGGYVAFEVGEVRQGRVLLETRAVPAAVDAGLIPRWCWSTARPLRKRPSAGASTIAPRARTRTELWCCKRPRDWLVMTRTRPNHPPTAPFVRRVVGSAPVDMWLDELRRPPGGPSALGSRRLRLGHRSLNDAVARLRQHDADTQPGVFDGE